MSYCTLQELIDRLEYGTKLHVSVVFPHACTQAELQLAHASTIHSSPVCDRLKSTPQGFRACYRCRQVAVRKALRNGKPFGGLCRAGVYEYVHPVVENGAVFAIVFVGNVLPPENARERLLATLGAHSPLLASLEQEATVAHCESVGQLVESYIRMLCALAPDNAPEDDDPLLSALKNHVEANLEYPLSLCDLARAFHYNPKYLGRLFRAKVGLSFHEYLTHRRLEHAKALLEQGEESVLGISLRCGFQNVTYFNRVFKKVVGLTPTAYRAQGRTPRG